jgi:hypothetical protein
MPDQKKNDAKELIIARMADYVRTFQTKSGRRVMKDLRKSFCSIMSDPNPFVMARNVGSFEVIAKIEGILKKSKAKKGLEDLFRQPEDEGFEVEE